MGQVHASSYRQIDGVKVSVFSDPLSNKAPDSVKQYHARFTTSVDEIINDSKIDIVDVCLPTPCIKNSSLNQQKLENIFYVKNLLPELSRMLKKSRKS